MIGRLRLTHFGRFEDREFDLGPTTVFLGPNESGKTTLFDALTQAICKPDGRTSLGKRLADRYGDSIRVELEPALPSDFQVDRADYFGLNAVRAADIQFGDAYEGNWVSQLKARLMTSGVDLEAVVRELEKRASEKGNLKHNKELADLVKDLDTRRGELENQTAKRDRALGGDQALAALESQLADQRAVRTERRRERDNLAARLADAERILQRQRLEKTLKELDDRQQDRKRFEELEAFCEDRTHELNDLEENRTKAQADLKVLQAQRNDQQTRLDRARGDLRDSEGESATSRRLAERAQALKEKTAQVHSLTRLRTTWNGGFLAVAVMAAVAGVLAVFLFEGALGLGLLGGLAVASVAMAFTARRPVPEPDREAQARFLTEQQERWNAELGEDLRLKVTTLEGLVAELDGLLRKSDVLDEKLAASKEGRAELESGQEVLVRKVRTAKDDLESAERAVKKWYDILAVASRDEYAQRLGECAALDKALQETPSEEESATERLEVERKLNALDQDGVPKTGTSEEEVQALKRQLADMGTDLEAIERRIAELDKRLEGQSREMGGRLEGIPEAMARLEAEIRSLECRISQTQGARRAAGLAAKLFRTVSEAAGDQLSEIAEEMQGFLRVGLGEGRAIRAGDLTDEDVQVEDAVGQLRSLSRLSTGTRDLVALAGRLALARKVGELQLLVLDEPFAHLDPDRERSAVKMIQRFQESSGWQVVVFTKEERTAGFLQDSLDQVRTHALTW